MQRIASTIAAVLLLALASCQRHDPGLNTAFMLQTPRTEILAQLNNSGAQILENTESNVVADLKRPKGGQPMHVRLDFADGKLESVQYLPQAGR